MLTPLPRPEKKCRRSFLTGSYSQKLPQERLCQSVGTLTLTALLAIGSSSSMTDGIKLPLAENRYACEGIDSNLQNCRHKVIVLTLVSVQQDADSESSVYPYQLLSTSGHGAGIVSYIRAFGVVLPLQKTGENPSTSRHHLAHGLPSGDGRMGHKSQCQCCLIRLAALGN